MAAVLTGCYSSQAVDQSGQETTRQLTIGWWAAPSGECLQSINTANSQFKFWPTSGLDFGTVRVCHNTGLGVVLRMSGLGLQHKHATSNIKILQKPETVQQHNETTNTFTCYSKERNYMVLLRTHSCTTRQVWQLLQVNCVIHAWVL